MPLTPHLRPFISRTPKIRTTFISPSCRHYSAPSPQQVPPSQAAEEEAEDGAMQRRLQDLAESAQPIPDDPKAGIPSSTISEIDLLKLQDRISQASFEQSFPRAFAEANLPRSADKLTRNIAADRPWTGEESTPDAVLRQLTDVHKPIKMPVPKPTLSSLPLRGPKKVVSPKSTSGKLSAAKEASQGYSLLKEKLSPGFRAMPATMEGLASLAEERIQEARARGEFKHLPGRGKPAKKDHLNDSPHIDRTEYFLNRILQRQGAAPPWVQAQVDLTSAFAQFRQSIRTEWLRHVTRQISTAPGNMNSHISAAEAYVRRDTAANFTVREYKVEWESREKAYHSLAVNDLNSKARSYNMIAPYTARKAYTDLQKELEQCYKDVAPQIVDTVRARATAPPPPNVQVKPFVRGAVGILEDLAGPKEPLHVSRDGEYGLMDFFRGFLKRETR